MTNDARATAPARTDGPSRIPDDIDVPTATGWSVVVRGRLEEVTHSDRDLFERVADLAKPWAEGEKPHVLRLVAESIQGRRIS